jgi:hypothetical protein
MRIGFLIAIIFISAIAIVYLALNSLFTFFDTPILKGEANLIMKLMFRGAGMGFALSFMLISIGILLAYMRRIIKRMVDRRIEKEKQLKLKRDLKLVRNDSSYIPVIKDDPGLKVAGGYNE